MGGWKGPDVDGQPGGAGRTDRALPGLGPVPGGQNRLDPSLLRRRIPQYR